MFIIKVVSNTLIPIALYVSYIMLMTHLEKLYKDDDFDRYHKYTIDWKYLLCTINYGSDLCIQCSTMLSKRNVK